MSGKIILNLAISLDGYIASEDGGFEWIVGHGDDALNTEEGFDFPKFMEVMDVVVMGKQCYNQGFAKDFPTKQVIVATSDKREAEGNITFIGGDVVRVIEAEKSKGKNVYLFGGGALIDPFLKANAIDEYIIGVIPTILGKGRRLFLDNNPTIPLHLDKYCVADGVTVLYYSKR